MSQPTTRGVRFAPAIPGSLRALAESHIPDKGETLSEVFRRAVTDYLDTPADITALESAERRLVALRLPPVLGARLDARAAADTLTLRLASGDRRSRAVSRTDVVVAALSALDQP
ncbi:MAG: hypothetical protein HHJ14_02310 [Cellulomonas sp.]|nr:hypothetical protein [Cellulomonas sp.]